jgi:predicted chitinase
MSYLDTLSVGQRNNVNYIISEMSKNGVTNPFAQAGILAVLSKESNFNKLRESSYRNTSNERIRSKFSRARDLSDSELDEIKSSDQKFFNLVYGKRYGNDGYGSWLGYSSSWDLPFKDGNDGYRYLGRGWNQITFKGNYKKVGEDLGVDLLKNPELLEDKKIATKAVISYYKNAFDKGFSGQHQDHYNSKDLNDFKSVNDAVLAMYHANAGFGKPMYTLDQAKSSSSGLKKAVDRAPEFYELTKSGSKKKIVWIVISLVALAVLITGLIVLLKKKK